MPKQIRSTSCLDQFSYQNDQISRTPLGKLILHFNVSPWFPPSLQIASEASAIVLYTLELDTTFFTFLKHQHCWCTCYTLEVCILKWRHSYEQDCLKHLKLSVHFWVGFSKILQWRSLNWIYWIMQSVFITVSVICNSKLSLSLTICLLFFGVFLIFLG